MIDITKMLDIFKGAVLDPQITWRKYKEEGHSMQETLLHVTAPLIVLSSILTAILAWLFKSYTMFGSSGGVGAFLLSLVLAFAAIGLASFVFSFFAGVFKGKNDLTQSVAALSLTAVPGYLGSIAGTLPAIGLLLSLGLGIYSLILLYKIIPNYLEVPQEKRGIHFIVSLVSSFVLMLIVAVILGAGSAMNSTSTQSTTTAVGSKNSSGMLGSLGRFADITEAAQKDRYTPPKDGKITQTQMQSLLNILEKAAIYRTEQAKKLSSLEKTVKKDEFSFADLGKMASGMSSVLSASNAEMEIVKTSGGNWAEYTWIKEQLRIATMQKDINEAVKHNYALYQKYEKQLTNSGF